MTILNGELKNDVLEIVRFLLMMPLLSVAEMVPATGLADSRCRRILDSLHADGFVTSTRAGRLHNVQTRSWLTTQGVMLAVRELGVDIPWQASENHIKWLFWRLPMVEIIYRLAPTLLAHPGVIGCGPVYNSPDPDEAPIWFPQDLRLEKLIWRRDPNVHAIAVFKNGAWMPITYLGLTTTFHQMLDYMDAWMKFLETPAEPGCAPPEPAGWVCIGIDHLAAMHAAEVWANDRVWYKDATLVATADGRVVNSMKPMPFGPPLREPRGPVNLGRPERVKRWVEQDPVMKALNGKRAFRVFMFVAEWYGASQAQVEREVRDSGGGINSIIANGCKANLFDRREDGLYLGDAGMLALAHMDRISHKTVRASFQSLLNEDGRHRSRLRRHDQTVIDIAHQLRHQVRPGVTLDVYNGFRRLQNHEGLTQINPDAAVILNWELGAMPPYRLEAEFEADSLSAATDKLEPHRLLQQNEGDLVTLLMVCANQEMERLFWAAGKGLMMLTTTLEELIASGPAGSPSPWRHFGRPVDLLFMEELRLQQKLRRLSKVLSREHLDAIRDEIRRMLRQAGG